MFVILVEVGGREYKSRLAIAQELAARSRHEVLIGSKEHLMFVMLLARVSGVVVLDKCGAWQQNWRYSFLKKFSNKLTVLDEEGIFTTHEAMHGRVAPGLDAYFFNNSRHKKAVLRLFPNAYLNSEVTGNPRLTKNLARLPSTSKSGGTNILFVGSFDKDHPEKLYTYDQMNRNEIENKKIAFDAINLLLDEGYNVVYRPHPADGTKFLESVSKRVTVQPLDVTMSEAISMSDVIINSGCTTSVEAYRQCKKLITFGVPYHVTAVMNGLGIYCKSATDIVRACDWQVKRKKTQRTEYVFQSYCPDIDLPEQKIATHLLSIQEEQSKISQNIISHNSMKKYLKLADYFLKVNPKIDLEYLKHKFGDYPLCVRLSKDQIYEY